MPKKAAKDRASRPGSLALYWKKRDFAQTPEPSGRKEKAGKRLRFVVQMHAATRLHYDFRLEADGVLASWAIPKGPTLAPGDRRLAMHVEDHPMNYREFEGVIPKGQYGGGEVIVWDEGWYQVVEGDDPATEIAGGKIKFVMHGEKLHGEFTLVKIKAREHESGEPWLLIKDKDEYADPKWDPAKHPKSVKTGKTLADVAKDPKAKTWQSKPRASRAAAAPKPRAKLQPLPKIKSVMLATLVDEPFDDPAWLFEIKWDGFRAVCTIDAKGALKLESRNGLDLLARFPQLAGLADAFESVPIVVDGEVVSLDSKGRSSFQRLQEAQKKPGTALTYVAFDVLYADGRDVRKEPLEERKALLERLIADDDLVLYSKHVLGKGTALFAQAQKNGLEGIVGKIRTSVYQERRTRDWVKIKAQLEQEFVVGGYTAPRGSRSGFGSLLLGAYDGKKLRYVGHVGTGFSHKVLAELQARLKKIERKTSPFDTPVETNMDATWVKPELVVQVRFTEWTRDGYLRHPAYLGLRPDKDAREVTLELPEHVET